MKNWTHSQFDELAFRVWKGLQALIPPELQAHLEQVHVLILDSPTQELRDELIEGFDEAEEELMGLHVGVPLTEESVISPSIEPVRVYIFRKAHLQAIQGEESDFERLLAEEIAVTLLHEVGHFFGLEENDLQRLGYD